MRRNADNSICQKKFESEAKAEDEAIEKPGGGTIQVEEAPMPSPGGLLCIYDADGKRQVRKISTNFF